LQLFGGKMKIFIFMMLISGGALSSPYSKIILKNSLKLNINPELITLLIRTESEFNPKAVSPVGAEGLMQLMPKTAKRFGVLDSFDPRDNIEGGTKYISYLLHRYGYIDYALAAYNAGEDAVEKHGGIPPYPETQNYVLKIRRLYKKRTGRELEKRGQFFVREFVAMPH
jgi:soluble lytic murein transglycosylase-like protein